MIIICCTEGTEDGIGRPPCCTGGYTHDVPIGVEMSALKRHPVHT